MRTLTATNLSGGLPLAVVLVTSPGYAVDPATFDLAPDAAQLVIITKIDPSADGTLRATGTSNVPGAVRSAVALSTRFLHRTWIETHGLAVAVLLTLFALAFVGGLWAVRKRWAA